LALFVLFLSLLLKMQRKWARKLRRMMKSFRFCPAVAAAAAAAAVL